MWSRVLGDLQKHGRSALVFPGKDYVHLILVYQVCFFHYVFLDLLDFIPQFYALLDDFFLLLSLLDVFGFLF